LTSDTSAVGRTIELVPLKSGAENAEFDKSPIATAASAKVFITSSIDPPDISTGLV
jgi:hypothetical protein